jgi:hypothetical protein
MSEGSDIPVKIRVMAVDEATSAFQKASAAAIQYEQKIAAYTQSKGANVTALKSMQGKLATLQATKQQADATMMQARLEERLFQATHTHEQIMLRDLEQRLAVQRQMYQGNAQIQSQLTKTFEAEKAQMAAGGGGMVGGIGKREMRHVLRSGAGMALGQGGGEIGGIASMGIMIGGTAGAAVAGLMLIGEAYKSATEQAKKLAETQKEYNKDLREAAAWSEKETARKTTAWGSKNRERVQQLKEKAAEIHDAAESARLTRGYVDKATAGWARVFTGNSGKEGTEADTTAAGRNNTLIRRREQAANEEAAMREKIAAREEVTGRGNRQEERTARYQQAKIGTMAPGVAKDRAEMKAATEEEALQMKVGHDARRQAITDEHDLAIAAVKRMKHGTEHNKILQSAAKEKADTKYEADLTAADTEAAEDRQSHQVAAGLKEQAFNANLKRQELADQQGAHEATIRATECGFQAEEDAAKSHYDFERKLLVDAGNSTAALDENFHAGTLARQRALDYTLEEMAVHAAQTKMQIENRAATNSLRNDQQGYAAKIQEIKNQRDETNQAIIDKAEIDRKRDPKKAAAIDKQAKLDIQKNKQGANQEILQEGKAHAREVANLEWDTKQQQLETTDKFNVMMLRAGHKFYEADKAEITNHLKEKTAAIQAEADRANALEKDPAKVAAIKADAKAKIERATLDAAGSMKELRDRRLRESLSLALPQGGVSGHLTGSQAISREMNNPGRGMLASLAKEKPPTREQTDKTNGLLEKLVYAMTHNVGGTIESLLGQSYGGN